MKNTIVVDVGLTTSSVWGMNLFRFDALSQLVISQLLFVPLTLIMVISPSYASLMYNVDRSISQGHVLGTITTNGQTGILASSDFVDWSLTISDLSHSTIFTPLNSIVSAANVIATFEDLSIDFTDKTDSAWFASRWGSVPGYGWSIEHFCDITQFCNDIERIHPAHLAPDYVQWLTGRVSFAIAQVPEPSTLGLLGMGILGIIARRLRHISRKWVIYVLGSR